MPDILEAKIDTHTFKVITGRLYNIQGLWAREEGNKVRVGLSDFLQFRIGSVAAVNLRLIGKVVDFNEQFAILQSSTGSNNLFSPVAGTVFEINPLVVDNPTLINQDPYGDGWLVDMEATNWLADHGKLMEAEDYFERMKQEAETFIEES